MNFKKALATALILSCTLSVNVHATDEEIIFFENSDDSVIIENEESEVTLSDSSDIIIEESDDEVGEENSEEISEEISEEPDIENEELTNAEADEEKVTDEEQADVIEEELDEVSDELLDYAIDSSEFQEDEDEFSLLSESKLAVQNQKVVNLKNFGAVGDGVTDDTNAVVKALKAANGKELYVPAGTYCVSDFDISNISVHMYSDENPVFLKIAAKKNPTFTFRGCTSGYIEGITFDGNRQYFGDDVDTALVYFRNSSNIEITGCKFYNCSREATAFLNDCSNINVHDNYFENTSAVFWLAKGTVQHAKFENNVCYNGRINGVEVALEGTSLESYDLVVRNNEFHDFPNGAIVLLKGISQVVVDNNYIDNVKHFVMCSYPYDKNSTLYNVSDLSVTNNSGRAQFFTYAFAYDSTPGYTYYNLSYTGNTFTVESRISVNDCDRLTFHNNSFSFIQDADMRISNSNRVKLNNERIAAEESSKILILADNCGELNLNTVKNSSDRILLRVTNESNTKLTLKNITTDFYKLNSNIKYPTDMYVECVGCTNTGKSLPALYSENGVLTLPIIGNDFEFKNTTDLQLKEIISHAKSGDMITITNLKAGIRFSKTKNIRYNITSNVSKGTKAELLFDGTNWNVKENLDITVECSGDCSVEKLGTAHFSVSATGGSGQYTYKWYRSTDQGKTWTRTNTYVGDNPAEISFIAYSKMYSYLFKCEVIDNKTKVNAFSDAMKIK